MKTAKIISVTVLLAAVFVSISLGMNALYSLLPEINDGITSRSIFISLGAGWTRERFFSVFEKSVWVTFAILVENVILHFVSKIKTV